MVHILIDDITPRNDYVVTAAPQTLFAYDFPIFADADLDVYVGTTLLTLTTDYTVTGAGADDGGTVTLVVAVTNTTVAIVRNLDIERVTDFPPSGPLQTDALNTELDRIVAMLQQVADGIERSVRLPEDEATSDQRLPDLADRASKFAAWNALGNLIGSSGGPPSTVIVSTFVEPVLGAADAEQFFDLLNVGTMADLMSAAFGLEYLVASRVIWVRADATADTARTGNAEDVASAFKTWGAAIAYADASIMDNGFSVIFSQAETGVTFPQTYAPAAGVSVIALTGRLRGGGTRIFRFRMTGGNDDDVRLDASGSGSAIGLNQDPGIVTLQGKVRFSAAPTTGICFRNSSAGRVSNEGKILSFGNVNTHIQNQQDGAYFANNGEIDFDGDADNYIRNDSGTFHDNGIMTVIGNRTFTAFYRGDFFSQGYLGLNISATGTTTGQRVDLRHRAALLVFADVGQLVEVFNDLPGDSRGPVQPGCSVVDMFWNQQLNVVRGTATFAAATTVVVTFASLGLPDQPDTNYLVTIGGGNPARQYAVLPANRLTTGFTITGSASNSDTVWWRLEWL